MLRSLLVVLALLISLPVMAQSRGSSLDLSDLPDSVKADIMEKANRAKEDALRNGTKKASEAVVPKVSDAAEISKKTREELESWGVLGAGAGKAVVGAAKELGMAANDFAGTGLGKFIIVLIAFKVIGKTILGIMFGSALWAICLNVGWRIIKPFKTVEYATTPVLWGLFSMKRSVKKEGFDEGDRSDEETITRLIVGAIVMCAGTIASLIIIL